LIYPSLSSASPTVAKELGGWDRLHGTNILNCIGSLKAHGERQRMAVFLKPDRQTNVLVTRIGWISIFC
jgi:hypothetical protein